jgi:hypothetical protein
MDRFSTPRLTAERLNESHLEDLAALHLDPEVSRYLGGVRSAETTKTYLAVIGTSTALGCGCCERATMRSPDGQAESRGDPGRQRRCRAGRVLRPSSGVEHDSTTVALA